MSNLDSAQEKKGQLDLVKLGLEPEMPFVVQVCHTVIRKKTLAW